MATNRLEQMKRRLLDQQNNKQKPLISVTVNKASTSDVPPIDYPPKAAASNIVESPQNSIKMPNQPQPFAQQLEKEANILQDKNKEIIKQVQQLPEEPQLHVQALPKQPANLQMFQKRDEAQNQSNDKEIIEENHASLKQSQSDDNNRPQQGQIPSDKDKKNKALLAMQEKSSIEEAANLDLVDKQPNFSCSVDEEAKGGGLAEIPESKVEKKQRKIVLKELEAVKHCVRNLKSAVKGLKLLEKKVSEKPKLRDQLRTYLVQLSKFEQERNL